MTTSSVSSSVLSAVPFLDAMSDLQDIRLYLDLDDEVEKEELSVGNRRCQVDCDVEILLESRTIDINAGSRPTVITNPSIRAQEENIKVLKREKSRPCLIVDQTAESEASERLEEFCRLIGAFGHQYAVTKPNWHWYRLDGNALPCVLRGGAAYLAVQMVQLGLLVPYTFVLPDTIVERHKMPSQKMSATEAQLLNTINAQHCQFRFGLVPLSEGDELVLATQAESFYWAVKVFNLERMLEAYDRQIHNRHSPLPLLAHIHNLKCRCEEKLKVAEQHRSARNSQSHSW